MYSPYHISLSDRIKNEKLQRPVLFWLIIANVSVWILLSLLQLVHFLNALPAESVISYFALPADVMKLSLKPWTVITYMFTHQSFWHLFFNMIWLYWFSKIFLEFKNGKYLLMVYVLGGIFGGLTFLVAYNIFPVFAGALPMASCIGASASVLAITVATAFLSPNYNLSLLFLGNIKIKHIVIVILVIDVLMIRYENPGGHFAHLGGALTGFVIYGITYLYTKHKEKQTVKTKRSRMRVKNVKFTEIKNETPHTPYHNASHSSQDQIDIILEKIAKSGYASLSKEEKDLLFKSSNK